MAFTKSIRSFNRRKFFISKLTRLHMGVMFAAVMLAGVMSVRAQVIEFPMHANDLNAGERILTDVHGTGGGPQTGAKDLIILRRVANNNWRNLKVDTTEKTKRSLRA